MLSSRCAYVSATCSFTYNNREAQTISYLCIRGKDERWYPPTSGGERERELNESQEAMKHGSGSVISGHTHTHVRSACRSLTASRGWVRSMVFRMNRFFIRKTFIYFADMGDTWRVASHLRHSSWDGFQISNHCISPKCMQLDIS